MCNSHAVRFLLTVQWCRHIVNHMKIQTVLVILGWAIWTFAGMVIGYCGVAGLRMAGLIQ